jgi:hypothetical protein
MWIFMGRSLLVGVVLESPKFKHPIGFTSKMPLGDRISDAPGFFRRGFIEPLCLKQVSVRVPAAIFFPGYGCPSGKFQILGQWLSLWQ